MTVTAHSDAPLMTVGYGDADLARILAYGGPFSKRTWCTVTVDGKVTERQEAAGPYAQVFCQG